MTKEKEFVYDVTEEDIEFGGATLHTQRITLASAKTTIVFLHDALGCIELWRDFPLSLCRATRCSGFVYDREGYGKSSPARTVSGVDYLENAARALVDLLKQLDLTKDVVLFGHSDGGSIALIAAALAPEMFRAVVTEAAHVFVEDVTIEGITKASEQRMELVTKLRKYHGDKAPSVFSAWSDVWRAPWFLDWNIEHFLPQIKCPIMAMQGTKDEYGTEKQLDAIVDQVSGKAVKYFIWNVGHTPHREDAYNTMFESAAFLCELVRV